MNNLKWTNSWRLGKKKKVNTSHAFSVPQLSLLVSGAIETSSRVLCKTYPHSDVYCDSDGCGKTWMLVRPRGRKWEIPNVSASKKQNQKSPLISSFCGFLFILLAHAPWRISGGAPEFNPASPLVRATLRTSRTHPHQAQRVGRAVAMAQSAYLTAWTSS